MLPAGQCLWVNPLKDGDTKPPTYSSNAMVAGPPMRTCLRTHSIERCGPPLFTGAVAMTESKPNAIIKTKASTSSGHWLQFAFLRLQCSSACGGGSDPADQVASGHRHHANGPCRRCPARVAEHGGERLFLNRCPARSSEPAFTPMAAGTTTATYTPAQILRCLQPSWSPCRWHTRDRCKGRTNGCPGQTIYIVNAYHNPNADCGD